MKIRTIAAYSDGNAVVSSGNGYSTSPGSRLTFGTEDWSDTISVSAGDDFIIGVLSNGTVVSSGSNDLRECNVGHLKCCKSVPNVTGIFSNQH